MSQKKRIAQSRTCHTTAGQLANLAPRCSWQTKAAEPGHRRWLSSACPLPFTHRCLPLGQPSNSRLAYLLAVGRAATLALQSTEADGRSGQGHDCAHALAFTPTHTGEEDGAKRTWAGWRTIHTTRHSIGHPTSIRPSSHTAHWRRDPGSLAGRRPAASNLAREGDPGPRSTTRRRACWHHLWDHLWYQF